MRALITATLIWSALFLGQSFASDTETPVVAASLFGVGQAPLAFPATTDRQTVYTALRRTHFPGGVEEAADLTPDELNLVVRRYCMVCHNDRMLTADLTLQEFDVGAPSERSETAEKMIGKLRLGMMPPPGMPRPGPDTLLALVGALETRLDEAAALHPDPGGRSFQRLNQVEYAHAVEELLGLRIDAGAYLPMDTKSDNFDNIADVQLLSPTLLDAYLRAAAEISRLAVGQPDVTRRDVTYVIPRSVSQTRHVEGAPYGTRGGTAVEHYFPVDGQYTFQIDFYLSSHGGFIGGSSRAEQADISVDGRRVALLDIDRFIYESDPSTTLTTEPIPVTAGPHVISAAFIAREGGTPPHLLPVHEWSMSSQGQTGRYGVGGFPHMRNLVIGGPYDATGVSETPSRKVIFRCRPDSPEQARPCAEEIAGRLARKAFRRAEPLSERELEGLMGLYDHGASEGGFEEGVRTVLEGILASPDFVFRFEPVGPLADGESVYRLGGEALATRLSFFLWASLPDEELLSLAREGSLSDPEVLEAQVRRMLADPRAETLSTHFFAQWLRLADLEHVQPNAPQYPNFDEQLRDAMRRETELLFDHIVREDRSVLDLWTADYTFVNERLAKHYGIPDVAGSHFRRVPVTDEHRKGLLGHASILTSTSMASRTSPTVRGKWVMEVFLNSPPPPPPPGVPELDATSDVAEGGGRLLTVREQMEIHRSNPACASCHRVIDPIGLALENYDVTGQWRIRDKWMMIDSRSELWDGTPLEKPADLRRALLQRPEVLLRTFTQNLMAYALGRRIEPQDMPTVRSIVREAEANDHRVSSYIVGVVQSPAFRMRSVRLAAADAEDRPVGQEDPGR